MTGIDRRTLLRAGAVAALAGPFTGFVARQDAAARHRPPSMQDLSPVGDMRDGVRRLALPRGFSYRSFQPAGGILADGTTIPGRHDGMAAFRNRGGAREVTLVRNHEINGAGGAFSSATPVYDTGAGGGTTSAVVDDEGHELDSWASLAGTMMNCSGGPMPWESWATCEETVNGVDVFDDFTRGSLPPDTYITNAILTRPHGFLFEVPADGQSAAEPVRAAGRMAHEAIAYAPEEGVFYLTEDDFGFPSGFYRYVPPSEPRRSQRLEDGGRLFMLAVVGHPRAHLEASQPIGTRYDVTWVPIEDPARDFPMAGGRPTVTNDEAIKYVASQGWPQGGAFFGRLEGAAYDRGVVYFTATQGGGDAEDWEPGDPPVSDGYGNGRGQVWAYHVREGVLELVYESPSADVLDFPDNLTTSRRGTLVLCEDGSNGNWLRGLDRRGDLFDIARNLIPVTRSDGSVDVGADEFAGSTFSPSGRTLYVNIQSSSGLSLAIWGPWGRIGV